MWCCEFGSNSALPSHNVPFLSLSFQIFSRGVAAIPLSIDLWTAYLDATLEIVHGREDYEERMRTYVLFATAVIFYKTPYSTDVSCRLYELALEKAGLEFRSDALWEHYISWESGHNRLGRALAIYDRLLRTPTQLYFQNWDSFKKLIEENRPEDVLTREEFAEFLARVAPVAGTAMRIALNDPTAAKKPLPEVMVPAYFVTFRVLIYLPSPFRV